MRIAIFTDTFYPEVNGVANTLKKFTNYLETQDISYKVFAPISVSNGYVSDHIHRLKSLSFFLYPECRLAFPNIIQLKTEIEQFSPDIIHVATPFTVGLSGVYFAKKLNIPLVGSYHTDFSDYLHFYDLQFLTKPLWKYMKWFHHSFKKLFVPSMDTLEKLNNRGFCNLEIWPRGVDCQAYHPYYKKEMIRNRYAISEKYILSFVGRLAPEKDLKTLMTVAGSLPPEISEQVHWLIAGDGPLHDELKMTALPNMTFTGYLKGVELSEAYSATDLFVFPSPTETFGNVVLEALASGTPVIGANSGGVKYIISNRVNGYLCEPGDAEDFIKRILHLLDNDSLRVQMGINARKYALTQKWDQIFEDVIHQYSNVINEPATKIYA
ncbi:glycosyltransferase family 1 protein [Neobacillus niacini]|uniref:glycosyltransferase family 4 protein n=1 Tax=Neobacillus niacini TaxID=86668 RepID=UPI00052FAB6B|nr:glycosyltransferase family 1 protein [Neobacillus niacini]KGM46390.1 glycosyl transferase [Neobacillus niacini]MEC1525580.1 glycosyltransferase family 1 protein [Neobacillus niacini]